MEKNIECNTEDFISAIEGEPVIWDSKLEEYSDKISKRNVWARIIQKFVENFDEKENTEKTNIAAVYQRKWKSLRDSYARELLKQKQTKSGSGAKNRKQYIFFNQLSFLQTVSKSTTSSLAEEIPVEGTSEDDGREVTREAEEFVKKPIGHKKRKIQKEVEEENALLLVIKERITNDDTRPGPHINYDEDTMFLLSLVPELKKVPDHLKLDIKMEIMSVFKRASYRLQPASNFTSTSQQYQSFTQNYMPHQNQIAPIHHQPVDTLTSFHRTTATPLTSSPAESQYSQDSDMSFVGFN